MIWKDEELEAINKILDRHTWVTGQQVMCRTVDISSQEICGFSSVGRAHD